MKENTENKIDNGQLVKFSYKVTDKDGNELYEAAKEAPDSIIFGHTLGVLPGLETALKGLKAGDKFEVTLPPEAAYGNLDTNLVFELPYDVFSSDGKLPATVKEGASLPMMTDSGEKVYGIVTKISPDKVTMDFNHPFAGKTVNFVGEVMEVRPATDDELNPKGCGGCCGGGCGGGDCGDGCDGGDCGGCK